MKFCIDDPVAVSTLRRWRTELPPDVSAQVACLETRPEMELLTGIVAEALAEYFERHLIRNATALNLTRPYGHTLMHFLVAKHLMLGAEALAGAPAIGGWIEVRALLPSAETLELRP